jgi:hypothetical protein
MGALYLACCGTACGVTGGAGLSMINLLQLGFSFSASARIFRSKSKSKLKVLRGISAICGAN